MTGPEKQHIVEAAHFELGKVMDKAIRERMVEHFNHIDHDLAVRTAKGIGVAPPSGPAEPNHGRSSPALSQERGPMPITGRRVAVLVAPGVEKKEVEAVKEKLTRQQAEAIVVAKADGMIPTADGGEMMVDKAFVTTASVLFDAVYVPGGAESAAALRRNGDAIHFVNEAFRHCKPLAFSGEGIELLRRANIGMELEAKDGFRSMHGVVTGGDAGHEFVDAFVEAIAQHRHWDRAEKDMVPA
jgi:catalase